MSDESLLGQLYQTATESPKVAAVVAGGVGANGVYNLLADVQSGTAILSSIVGLLIGVVLLLKHGLGFWKEWKRRNEP